MSFLSALKLYELHDISSCKQVGVVELGMSFFSVGARSVDIELEDSGDRHRHSQLRNNGASDPTWWPEW